MEQPADRSRAHKPPAADLDQSPSPLQFLRRPAGSIDGNGLAPLARIVYGADLAPASPPPAVSARLDDVWARVGLERLRAGGAQEDLWFAGPEAADARVSPSLERVSGRTGCVRWNREGDWLFGVIEWSAADEVDGLLPLAERSYRDLFATLAECGLPALQRVWNYLPRINAPGLERERYQEFNIGRQRAFMAAGQSAFVGAPAACALGSQAEGLSIFFLAGRRPTVAIENPRQVSAYRYPDRYGPSAPTFSRAALTVLEPDQVSLFISGTASIVGHESVHVGDLDAQVAEIVRNLESLVGQANARASARFSVGDLWPVVYVRQPADAPQIERALGRLLDAGAPFLQRAVFLQADVCRHELQVEIEAFAQAPGRVLAA